jgi:hypothetical protein
LLAKKRFAAAICSGGAARAPYFQGDLPAISETGSDRGTKLQGHAFATVNPADETWER